MSAGSKQKYNIIESLKENISTHSISVFLFLLLIHIEKNKRFFKSYETEYKNEIRPEGKNISYSYFTLKRQ